MRSGTATSSAATSEPADNRARVRARTVVRKPYRSPPDITRTSRLSRGRQGKGLPARVGSSMSRQPEAVRRGPARKRLFMAAGCPATKSSRGRFLSHRRDKRTSLATSLIDLSKGMSPQKAVSQSETGATAFLKSILSRKRRGKWRKRCPATLISGGDGLRRSTGGGPAGPRHGRSRGCRRGIRRKARRRRQAGGRCA